MEQRAAVLNISPRDDVSMVSSSSDREAPFRRSPHHLLQVEQQEEQMSERYDQNQREEEMQRECCRAERVYKAQAYPLSSCT